MSPLKRSTNIAARMGRWSARHRKTAIFGWLAFVIAVVRDRHGRRHADDRPERHQRRRGPPRRPHHPRRRLQARRADRVRARAVEDCRRRRDPAFRAVVDDAIAPLERLPAGRRTPLAARAGQRGPGLDGRPLRADPVHARRARTTRRSTTSTRSPAGDEAVQKAQPRLLRRRGRLAPRPARRSTRCSARSSRGPGSSRSR